MSAQDFGFTPKQTAWLKLIALVFATGSGVVITTYLGGCKLWVAILAGLGTAGANVYHAMAPDPRNPVPLDVPAATLTAAQPAPVPVAATETTAKPI